MSRGRRIDTHSHIVPEFYAKWLEDKHVLSGGFPIPAWSADAALDFMERHEIATSILSVSTPGVECGDPEDARAMARRLNEYAANVCLEYPGRFGFFATPSLINMEGAIEDINYAFDHLGADGVVLNANVDGTYLGDPRFADLMDALNRRGAVAFIHPSELPGGAVPGLPAYVADFLLDTVRAAVHLCATGAMSRYPDIKFILSHGGGFLPYAAFRVAAQASPNREPREGMNLLRRFYLDSALATSKFALPSLLAFADPVRIVFGSDFPFAPVAVSGFYASQLDGSAAVDHAAIDRGNAERLFPRFAE
ncbi:amidohydrolase family protein [Methylocapsa sp. S129]|uniref:amidohydrolase family protein n=1 Tax=Methylocapsa sp. S129 TaxID=1641869 RepID=UPI00131B49BD|nr:amidohydrolase family protein [Methylocapsa sp. S129]